MRSAAATVDVAQSVADSNPPVRSRDRSVMLTLLGVFALSRAAYALAGLRFLAHNEINYHPQLLAPDLLRRHLLESIWYLHAQPPLFNAMVGAVLKWSPFPVGVSLQVVYLGFGVALILGLYDLARLLRLGVVTSVVVAVVVGCGPPVVLWENVASYDYIVAVLLVLVVDATARWVRGGHARALGALCGLAAVTVLVRSLMHPLWFAAVVGLALMLRRPNRWSWKPVVAVALPVLLVSGVMLKNEFLFGSPQLSSWFGFNLYRVAVTPLTSDQQARLRRDDVLRAPPVAKPCHLSRPGVPALADEFKVGVPGPTQENANWDCLRPFYAAEGDDALRTTRAQPGWVMRSVAGSAEIWAAPSTFYWDVLENQRAVAWLDRAYRSVVLGDVRWNPWIATNTSVLAAPTLAPDGDEHVLVIAVLSTGLVLFAGVLAGIGWVRGRRRTPARAALVMGAFTLAFVTFVSIVFEHGENNRFRFATEPLTVVLAVAVVCALVRRIRDPRADGSTGSTEFEHGDTARLA